jgi:putative membrane protein
MVTRPLLTPEDHARLAAAVRSAEANTSGEIYVVVSEYADSFRLVPLLWGALIALLVPWPLLYATTLSMVTILLLQAASFVAASAILSLPQLRYRVVPHGIAEDATRRAAELHFMAHGIHLTAERTGVLLYVSMMPRRIEVVADDGIHSRVDQATWDSMVAQIASGARAGRLADGLVAAIRSTGEVLSQHFPRRPDDRNELPDRVVEYSGRNLR